MPSSTVEDYLKSILHLEEQNRSRADNTGITVGAIAEDLRLTPGTVSTMMRHLEEKGWIDYRPRHSVALRPEGRRQALAVVRRHRLIEAFLVKILKLDWSQVHEEAEILEHAVSERLLQRIDEMLGHPSSDPHGDPIPDAEGKLANSTGHPLSEVAPGQYRVARVTGMQPFFLEWLQAHALMPGGICELAASDPVAGVLHVKVPPCPSPVVISREAAAQILVEAAD